MKTSIAIALGMGLGLLAGAALLVTLPRTALPCEVIVTYTGKSYKPTGVKSRFFIVDVKKQKTLSGRGNFGPASVSCEVDLSRSTPI